MPILYVLAWAGPVTLKINAIIIADSTARRMGAPFLKYGTEVILSSPPPLAAGPVQIFVVILNGIVWIINKKELYDT